MNKLALSAAVAVLALSPVLSQAAHADDNSTSTPTYGANVNPNWQDNFFVAGQLGQTQYRVDSDVLNTNHGTFQNIRFGWRWNGIIGPEIGYTYLGQPKWSDGYNQLSVKPRAATIGVNGKYNFYQNWFVTAHAGYLRSETKFAAIGAFGTDRYQTWNNGLYAGLGVGYDITHNFSLGLNYDNYRLQSGNGTSLDNIGVPHSRTNVAAYSASVEYRF
ncbi:outer membrane protein [Dyella monticola]|nr:outer membrane beta-barrel protein [Dyella monticola]